MSEVISKMEEYNSSPHLSEEAKQKIAEAAVIGLDKLRNQEYLAWQQAHYDLAQRILKRAKAANAKPVNGMKLKIATCEVSVK
jgi:hypothetical protein